MPGVYMSIPLSNACNPDTLKAEKNVGNCFLSYGAFYTVLCSITLVFPHGVAFIHTSVLHSVMFNYTSVPHGVVFIHTRVLHSVMFNYTSVPHGVVFIHTRVLHGIVFNYDCSTQCCVHPHQCFTRCCVRLHQCST